MKKISTLLFATIVSLTAMAGLNPYAYGLSSSWDATDQKLTVNFNLNDKANKITIFAIDSENANNKFTIYEGNPGTKIDFSGNNGVVIKFDGRKFKNQNGVDACLVAGKKYTFAIQVDGTARNTPGTPVYTGKRPYSPHGVAVNNCQDSQDFGAVYVTECTNGVSGNATWGWLSDKGKSLLKYNPRLGFESSYRKSSPFSDRNPQRGGTLEPHRVVVSDDGRIFVSSYNTNTDGKTAVWEFYPQTGEYREIVKHDASRGERVVAIDVKGSGNNIKMLVCYYTRNGSPYKYGWYVCEYSVGSAGSLATFDVVKFQYFTTVELYQNTLNNAYNSSFSTYTDGFFDVAYGAKNESTVYMGLDYFIDLDNGKGSKNRTSLIYCYYNAALNPQYQYYNRDGKVEGEHWGGGGIVTWLDHYGNERIAMGGNKSGSNNEDDGCIQTYTLNGSNVPSTKAYNPIQTNTRKIINDFAIDCANNLYAVSFTDGANSNNVGSGTLLAVPMPYSGTVTTNCPRTNADANKYFKLPDRTTLHMNDTDEDELNRIVGNNSPVCDCDISLYRPMQADMFNTICLPFNLNLETLSDGHPLKGAELKAFTGATLSDTDSGEKILNLNFEDVNSNTLTAYTPYLIEPMADISGAINIDNITFVASGTTTVTQPITNVNNNSITFKGIVPSQTVTPKEVDGKSLTMMLVSDNRLAMMTEEGTMPGFRGYFEFLSTPPQGMQARISTSKNTTTDTEVVIDGQKVNIEKFLREGRVYIRVGEALYTLDGQKVE